MCSLRYDEEEVFEVVVAAEEAVAAAEKAADEVCVEGVGLPSGVDLVFSRTCQ